MAAGLIVWDLMSSFNEIWPCQQVQRVLWWIAGCISLERNERSYAKGGWRLWTQIANEIDISCVRLWVSDISFHAIVFPPSSACHWGTSLLWRACEHTGLICTDRGATNDPPISCHSTKRWQTNPSAGKIGRKRTFDIWMDDQSIDSGWFSRIDLIEVSIRNKKNYLQNMLAIFAFDALRWL